jgi:hypothetical protein
VRPGVKIGREIKGERESRRRHCAVHARDWREVGDGPDGFLIRLLNKAKSFNSL